MGPVLSDVQQYPISREMHHLGWQARNPIQWACGLQSPDPPGAAGPVGLVREVVPGSGTAGVGPVRSLGIPEGR